jgi:hypothetical protein
MYRLSDPRRERYTELMAQVDRLKLHSRKFGQCRLVTTTQLNIACELRVARRKKFLEKSVKVKFLTLPRKGTTPQILRLKFPVHTSYPKKKRK